MLYVFSFSTGLFKAKLDGTNLSIEISTKSFNTADFVKDEPIKLYTVVTATDDEDITEDHFYDIYASDFKDNKDKTVKVYTLYKAISPNGDKQFIVIKYFSNGKLNQVEETVEL